MVINGVAPRVKTEVQIEFSERIGFALFSTARCNILLTCVNCAFPHRRLANPKQTQLQLFHWTNLGGIEMQPRIGRTSFSLIPVCLTLCVFALGATTLRANPAVSNVLIRDNFGSKNRSELISKLRAITGWSTLDFDSADSLRVGSGEITRGSASARNLVAKAISGPNLIVLEESLSKTNVVFCQVVPAKWTRATASSQPAFVLQIDFDDFNQVLGDRRAREAFDVAWAVLHELDHVVNDTSDGESLGTTGGCEININVMRRELNLAERAEYYFTYLTPANTGNYKSRFVKLAFQQRDSRTNKTKRYWLLWDADVVGGLPNSRQIASRR